MLAQLCLSACRLRREGFSIRRLSSATANRWRRDGQGPLVPLNRLFFSRTQITDRLASYYKFVFVRHPLERLVAGYLALRAAADRHGALKAAADRHGRAARSNSTYRVDPLRRYRRTEHPSLADGTRRVATGTGSSNRNDDDDFTFASLVRYILDERSV